VSLTIGIVTISFNQAKYLEDCIRSVDLADRSFLKHVIVDPGSTDGSRDIIERHRDRFSAVIFEPDRGPSDGLNKGFAACDADVIGYLNADDRLRPRALDWVQRFFQSNPEVEAIVGAISIMNESGQEEFRRRLPWGFDLQGMLDGYGTYVQQSTFFRKSAFNRTNGFHESNRTSWDTELAVDMLLTGTTFRFVPKCLGAFRLYDTSICGKQLLGGDQAAIQKRKADHDRIAAKIRQAGYSESKGISYTSRKLINRWSPIRRLLELGIR
jgi:glycosyltransferase involved in cell wall biosynthesis